MSRVRVPSFTPMEPQVTGPAGRTRPAPKRGDPAQPHASPPPTRRNRTPHPRRPGATARLTPADPAQPHASPPPTRPNRTPHPPPPPAQPPPPPPPPRPIRTPHRCRPGPSARLNPADPARPHVSTAVHL